MPTVKIVNNNDFINDEISINNGDLIIIYKGTDVINHLFVSSYRGDEVGQHNRQYCSVIQLESGLLYKNSPLKRKTNVAELKNYLFENYSTYQNCYLFKIIKNKNYSLNIKLKEGD